LDVVAAVERAPIGWDLMAPS